MTADIRSLAGHRAARVPATRIAGDDLAAAPDPEEAGQWELLAERAAVVLARLEEAAGAQPVAQFPGLLAETAGLRAALDEAVGRRLAIAAIMTAARNRPERSED